MKVIVWTCPHLHVLTLEHEDSGAPPPPRLHCNNEQGVELSSLQISLQLQDVTESERLQFLLKKKSSLISN